MFTRVFALLSLALFVSAGRIEARTPQCNGGTQHCCSGSFFSNGAAYSDAEGNIVGDAGKISDLLNDNCSLLNVVGSGCTQNQQATCCQGTGGNGFTFIDLHCSNLNLGL